MTLPGSVGWAFGLRGAALALVLLSSGGLTACGGGGSATTTPTTSARTTTAITQTATTPTPTATIPTVPSTPTTTTPTSTTSPEQQPGGAGDEQGARVPAQFTYRNGRLDPSVIMVPATFRIALDIRFAGGGTHGVRVGSGANDLVGYVGGYAKLLPGLRKGETLEIAIDGKPAGKIVSGLQPGP